MNELKEYIKGIKIHGGDDESFVRGFNMALEYVLSKIEEIENK